MFCFKFDTPQSIMSSSCVQRNFKHTYIFKFFNLGEFKDKSVTYDNIVSGLKAIRRLQIIYELDAQDISNWNIDGHPSQPFDGI